MDQPPPADARISGLHHLTLVGKDWNRFQLLKSDQSGPQTVIHVVVVVGNLVGQIGQLGFEGGLATFEETPADVAEHCGILRRTVLKYSFPGLMHEVETVEFGIAFLKEINRPERLEIVLESTEILHADVERLLAGVTERGVPQIMGKGHGLRQVLVELQGAGDGAGDLGNFDAVSQAGTEEIAFVVYENLGLVFKPPKRGAMHDPVSVALELTAGGRRGLGTLTPPAVGLGYGVRRQLGHGFSQG